MHIVQAARDGRPGIGAAPEVVRMACGNSLGDLDEQRDGEAVAQSLLDAVTAAADSASAALQEAFALAAEINESHPDPADKDISLVSVKSSADGNDCIINQLK